jgi:putative NIF3 family GTP cyclohydrolase 1 type 2
MKLHELYETAVRLGRERDPQGEEGIKRVLDEARKEYEELPEERRWEFDRERLTNPYADARILWGDPETEVTRLMVGIDAGTGEMLLADRLREKGRPLDAVLVHHPEGRALADLPAVMQVQADVWRRYGVPVHLGDALISERALEIRRHFHADNTERAVTAARLLGIPFMCCHTPSDNAVHTFLTERLESLGEDARVKDVIALLKELPEYQEAVRQGTGPTLFAGEESLRAGRIMLEMTGGTSGPVEVLEKYAAAGVGTLVDMHMGEEHRKKAAELKLNVVIAGHMASDSLGMNLVVDQFERLGVDILPVAGFIRVSRA